MNKYKCDECNRLVKIKGLVNIKGKFICHYCKINNKSAKLLNKICIQKGAVKGYISLEKALNKTYQVRGSIDKQNRIHAFCSVPKVLIGHKFKIILQNQSKSTRRFKK